MPFMTWNKKLSVGVAVLDDDHKKLIEIINELHEGIMAGHKKEILGAVLDHLVEYTKFHFAREEELFAQTFYAASAIHKLEHEHLIKRVEGVQARYMKAPAAMLDLELMSYLQNWLVTHIQGTDQKYGPHLNAKGIQ
jgi:hemerythrin